jgi:Zn-dependent protease with chaperone function
MMGRRGKFQKWGGASLAAILYVFAASVGAYAQPSEQEKAPSAEAPQDEAKKPSEKKSRFGGFASRLTGKDAPPAEKQIDALAGTLGIQTQSAFEVIGAKLEKANVCERAPSVVNPDQLVNAGYAHRRILDALLKPLNIDPKSITFEWYVNETPNCRTDLRRPNTFQCSTGLRDLKVTDETDTTKERALDDELAFVFAHELAHILRRHDKGAAEAARRADAVQQLSTIAGLVGALSQARWTKDASGAYTATMGQASMQSLWLALSIGEGLKDSSCDLAGADYAKDQESEADYLALDMLMRAAWPGNKPGELNKIDQAALLRFMTKLKAQSDLKMEKTSQAISSGLSELGLRALLAQGQSTDPTQPNPFSGGMTGLGMTIAFKVGLNLYSDYKVRQGMAFHPDPEKRVARMAQYLDTAWKTETSAATEESAARLKDRLERRALLARDQDAMARVADTPQQLISVLRTLIALKEKGPPTAEEVAKLERKAKKDAKAVDAKGAPAEASTAEPPPASVDPVQAYEAELTRLTGEVERLYANVGRDGPTAISDYALASYAVYKGDMGNARKYSLSATKKTNTAPVMFEFAVEQIYNISLPSEARPDKSSATAAPAEVLRAQLVSQAPQALEVLKRGVEAHGEASFYAPLIRTYDLLGDTKSASELRSRCLINSATTASLRAQCGESAGSSEPAASSESVGVEKAAPSENPARTPLKLPTFLKPKANDATEATPPNTPTPAKPS